MSQRLAFDEKGLSVVDHFRELDSAMIAFAGSKVSHSAINGWTLCLEVQDGLSRRRSIAARLMRQSRAEQVVN